MKHRLARAGWPAISTWIATWVTALIAALAVAAGALAHEGEDHGPPAAALSQTLLPRVATASEDFELVVVLEPARLVVYLDRQASNEPVAGARVDVEGAGLNAAAVESGAGTYALALAAPLPPGQHALTFTLQAGTDADLLSVTLEVPAPATAAAAKPPSALACLLAHPWRWPAAAATLSVAVLLGATLRRRQARRALPRTGATT